MQAGSLDDLRGLVSQSALSQTIRELEARLVRR
jgi:hypothetical protein